MHTFKIDVPEKFLETFLSALDALTAALEAHFEEIETDDEEDETDPCIVLPGMVVELPNGLVCQVFSVDATGRIVLDQVEELTDSFLSQ